MSFVLLALILDVPRYTLSIFLVIWFSLSRIDEGRPPSQFRVTAIIPCYNGGNGLERTARSLSALRNEGLIEIIAVNDGSTDDTSRIIERLKSEGVIDAAITHRRRQGKSAAINHAARFARGDLIFNVDADTIIIEAGSILQLQSIFFNEKTAGVSGNLFVNNSGENLLTSLQSLEYTLSFLAGRTMLVNFDAVACLSGAFSMYRKSIFVTLGGMDTGPGEDLEIGMQMRRLGYALGFVPSAVAQTNAPTTFLGLVRQRMRWERDSYWIRMIQYQEWKILRHGDTIGDAFSHIDFVLFEFLSTLLFPFYLIYTIYCYGGYALYLFWVAYVFMLSVFIINMATALAFLPHRLNLFDAFAVIVMPIYQGIILKIVRFIAYSSEILGEASKYDDFVPGYVRDALYRKRKDTP